MEQNVVLEMRDISKNFTGVRALSHVDFTLRKGEIHALMGENGAGKSTLIKVLTGVHEFESGSIHMAGNSNAIVNHSPQEAQANGISTVYQEVNLCPNLTVAENLFIGREPRKMGMIDWKQMNERSGKLLESLDIHVPPTQMLEECSIAIQQMIAIARAVDMKCRVLILDEPTSSLDDDEVEKLFVLMRRLRDEGVGIIFVTHFLEQVYAVCDRITVLRNGELVGEYETKDLPRVMLVAKMMGKDFDDLADIKGEHKDKKKAKPEPVIEAKGISHKGTIKPFDLTINKGEVIGLTGLLGSGRSELVRAIYGADKAETGTLKVKGKEAKINSPLDAMKLGMAYLPEDRKEWDNIFLQCMGDPDPKQIDGLGGTVSSNNKIVIVWKSKEPGVDVEYLVGQVIVGKSQVDYKSNCGNMTAAVGPYAVEEGMVDIVEPITTVRMLNRNTDKYINVTVPIDPETKTFAQEGDCAIAGVDGTAAELKVNFLNPAGAKTGKLLPTGNPKDVLDIPGFGPIEATILDVSNPMVLVRAEDIGLTGRELPEEVNSNKAASEILEKIRGAACCKMGFAKDLEDATSNSPAVPKVGFFTKRR